MAYQIKKSKRILESIELMDEDGVNVENVVEVDIKISRIADTFLHRYNNVIKLQNMKFDKGGDKTPEEVVNYHKEYGEAIISLFEVLFGEKQTKELLEYFEDNYVDMVTELFPFAIEVARKISQSVQKEKKLKRKQFKQAKRW